MRGIEIKAINDSTDNPEISGVAVDSKKAGRDFIFIAQRGTKYDGHNFINEAEHNGAKVIVAEEAVVNLPQQKDVIRITVSDSKKAGAGIIHNFYDRPADKARVIAITGTNGKTTISYLIEALAKKSGDDCVGHVRIWRGICRLR